MRLKRYTLENCDELLKEVYEGAEIGKSNLHNYNYYWEINVTFDMLVNYAFDTCNKCIATIPYLYGVSFFHDVDNRAYTVYLRDVSEFFGLLGKMDNVAQNTEKKYNKVAKTVIYTSNLSMKLIYFGNYVKFKDIKVIKKQYTAYASFNNVEFRCLSTYLNLNEEHLFCEEPIISEGIRTPKTDLSKEEYDLINYRLGILTDEVNKARDEWYGKISIIRMTRVTIVNLRMKGYCYNPMSREKFKKSLLSIRGSEEYDILKNTKGGGFNAYNPKYVNKVIDNVVSGDINSMYPSIIFGSSLFPVREDGEVKCLNYEEYQSVCDQDRYIESLITYSNVTTLTDVSIIKRKDIYCSKGAKFNKEGYLISADQVTMASTSIDEWTFELFYNFTGFVSENNFIFKQGYLPIPIRECLISFFEEKTKYKGIEENAHEYLIAKVANNVVYGNMAKDPLKYSGVKLSDKNEVKLAINEYNDKVDSGLIQVTSCYQWGIAVASIARYRLATLVKRGIELDCWLYTNTDSLKFIYNEEFLKEIDEYNNDIFEAHSKLETHRKFKAWKSNNIKDETKYLGLFELEEVYDKFKMFGRNQYMYVADNDFEISCSGLSKKAVRKYYEENYDNPYDLIEDFGQGTVIPNARVRFYQNVEDQDLTVRDKNGMKYHHELRLGVYPIPTSYTLGDTPETDLAKELGGLLNE